MITLALICLASLPANPPTVDGPPGPETKKQYHFLLQGMDDARQRLRTGQYRVTGRFVSDLPGFDRLDGPLTIFSAFDFDAKKFRFDRREPIRAARVVGQGVPPGTMRPAGFRGGRMIRVDDRTTACLIDSLEVRIGNLTPGAENDIRPLDVRKFGLFYWDDMSSFPATPYPRSLEYYEREEAEEVVQESRGVWRITWTFPPFGKMTMRRVLWLDEKAGYSPIRMELKYRLSSMPPGVWPEPALVNESTWIQVSGVWVPKTARVVNTHNKPEVESYEFAFDWEIVNGPIPNEVFTIKGMALPTRTQVLDDTLGRPVIVGAIGADHKVIDRKVDATPPPSLPRLNWRGLDSALPTVAAVVGVAVLAVAAGLKLRSSLRRGPNV